MEKTAEKYLPWKFWRRYGVLFAMLKMALVLEKSLEVRKKSFYFLGCRTWNAWLLSSNVTSICSISCMYFPFVYVYSVLPSVSFGTRISLLCLDTVTWTTGRVCMLYMSTLEMSFSWWSAIQIYCCLLTYPACEKLHPTVLFWGPGPAWSSCT